MPGNVKNAVPDGVMPFRLCQSFVRAEDFLTEWNEIRSGESIRFPLVTTQRREWQQSIAMNDADLIDLQAFWKARRIAAFYFYDVHSEGVIYDPTGTSGDGRYTVRFDGGWSVTSELGERAHTVSLTLREVN